MSFSSDSIRVLKVISETGSFSEAANVLCRVPSAVSYTVKKMEEELGVPLFDRTGKSARPTQAAIYILENSDWILNGIRDLKLGAYQVACGVFKEYTIALNYIVNPAPISELISELMAEFPATDFKIRTEVYNGAWDALYEGRADIVIGAPSSAPVLDGISTSYIGDVQWSFVVGRRHPLAQKSSMISSDEARAYPSIVVMDSARVLKKKRTWALAGQKVVAVANLAMVAELIKNNVGVGFLPTAFVRPYIEQGLLVEKKVQGHKQPVPVFYAWRNNRSGPLLDKVLEYINQPKIKQLWLS